MPFLIGGGIILLLSALIIGLVPYICYKIVFYSPKRKPIKDGEYILPPGKIYEEYRPKMEKWMQETRDFPYERVSVTSFDGLTLRGKYFEHKKGAPLEILFHGYQGNSDRDLCGGMQRCFALGRNALLVDHRASGESDGHVISFGIHESKDCLTWVNFAIDKFGDDVKIMLGGVSLGAATVLTTAGMDLPKNVVCVLGDCGFTSAKEIIQKVMKDMRLSPTLMYPFVKLGAKWYGKFNLEESSPLQSVSRCKVPVMFFHGDKDDYVPMYMSEKMFDACPSQKRFVVIEGAGHGLAFPANEQKYIDEIRSFQEECGF